MLLRIEARRERVRDAFEEDLDRRGVRDDAEAQKLRKLFEALGPAGTDRVHGGIFECHPEHMPVAGEPELMGNGCREGLICILDLAVEGGGTHIDEGALCGLLIGVVLCELADRLLDDLSIFEGDLARQREAVLPAVSDREVRDIGRILGASLGALLISSDFINAYSASTAIANGAMITLDVIPGVYSIDWVGYQGHVIPILVGVWILCFFEKRLHKAVPEMFDLFVTPLVSVSLAAYITVLFIGPIFVWLENAILGLLMWLLSVPLGIGYIVIGLIYSPSVVTGLYQMYTAIDVSMLAQYGVTYWLPIASAANISQGGACLAVALRTKSEKTKSLAVPSGISCLLGITEPAIFGVNLPKMKPFVCGMIGSACGALCCFIFHLAASGTGVTGIFGILLCITQPVQYIIMFAVAFGLTSAIYREEEV